MVEKRGRDCLVISPMVRGNLNISWRHPTDFDAFCQSRLLTSLLKIHKFWFFPLRSDLTAIEVFEMDITLDGFMSSKPEVISLFCSTFSRWLYRDWFSSNISGVFSAKQTKWCWCREQNEQFCGSLKEGNKMDDKKLINYLQINVRNEKITWEFLQTMLGL